MGKKFRFAHLLGGRNPEEPAAVVEEPKPQASAATSPAQAAATESADDDEDADDNEDDDPDDEEETDDDEARAASIIKICADAGLSSQIAATLIALPLSVAQVKERVAEFPKIKDAVALARKVNPAIGLSLADDFIMAGTSLKDARANLFEIIVSKQSPEIRNTHTSGNSPTGVKQQDYGWGKAAAKVNARLKDH